MANGLESLIKSAMKENQKSMQTLLISELRRFKNILQGEMIQAYLSYVPVMYKRTGHFLGSVSLDEMIKIDMTGNKMVVSAIINDYTWHDSISPNYTEANTVFILNDGYHVKKDVWFKDIPYFGFRNGTHFIEKAIEKFYANNPYNIKITIERPILYYY